MNSEFQGTSWTLCSSRYLVKIATGKPSVSLAKMLAPWTTSTGTNQHFGVYRKRRFSTIVHTFSSSSASIALLHLLVKALQLVGSFSAWGRFTSGTFHQPNSALSLVICMVRCCSRFGGGTGTGRRNACRNALQEQRPKRVFWLSKWCLRSIAPQTVHM
jgi:hypothetical protein